MENIENPNNENNEKSKSNSVPEFIFGSSEGTDFSKKMTSSYSYFAPRDERYLAQNITLATKAPEKIEIYQNVTFVVAAIGFTGVILTVGLGYWRMRKELKQALDLANSARIDSREQADADRSIAVEQANKERQHSADEAHRDRIATSRRLVYLDTAKQVVRANTFLGSLMGKKINSESASVGLHDLGIAISQITILGEMETILKSREVLSLINQSYFRAMKHSFPISSLNDDIEKMTGKRDSVNAELGRVQDSFNYFMRRNIQSIEVANLESSLRHLKKLAADISEDIASAYEKLSHLHMTYFDFMLVEIKEINRGTDELIVMIRSELELKTDTGALTQSSLMMHALATKAQEDLKATIDEW